MQDIRYSCKIVAVVLGYLSKNMPRAGDGAAGDEWWEEIRTIARAQRKPCGLPGERAGRGGGTRAGRGDDPVPGERSVGRARA